MYCNKNGQTYVNTLTPVPGATAEDATYVVDLTHFTCGNRKICANGAYPIAADLNFKNSGLPQPVGLDTYVQDVLITGTVTYVPYKNGQNNCGCGCGCNCPVTENVWAVISVPVTEATSPTLKAGETLASPTNLRDCCNVTNAVSLVCSFNVAGAAAAAGSGN